MSVGMCIRHLVHAVLLGALALRQVAYPQAVRPTGTIDGRVSDTTLHDLINAHVSLPGFQIELATDSGGRFRIADVPPGDRLVIVQRLGFQPVTTVVTVRAGDTTRIAVTLRPFVTQLEKVEVRSTAVDPWLKEFEQRRRRGYGQFATNADIEQLGFSSISAVLLTFHSVSVQKAALLNTRSFPRQCPLRIFVDGVPLNVRSLEADLPPPSEIAALEVYANTATVPVQYATYGGDGDAGGGGAFCGVVLIWRKH